MPSAIGREQVQLSFNSFTGFHRRVPAGLRHGGGRLSIPSPDSTYQLITRQRDWNGLSIPSPDSTRRAKGEAAGGRTVTFNSFTGFHVGLRRRLCAFWGASFQFLHQIPLEVKA